MKNICTWDCIKGNECYDEILKQINQWWDIRIPDYIKWGRKLLPIYIFNQWFNIKGIIYKSYLNFADLRNNLLSVGNYCNHFLWQNRQDQTNHSRLKDDYAKMSVYTLIKYILNTFLKYTQ